MFKGFLHHFVLAKLAAVNILKEGFERDGWITKNGIYIFSCLALLLSLLVALYTYLAQPEKQVGAAGLGCTHVESAAQVCTCGL